MGLSLQEQLLKAGLVNEKQVKKAEHDKRVQNKKKKKKKGTSSGFAPDAAAIKLQQQQKEQAEKDAKLNAERRQQAQLKEDQSAAKQMIVTNKVAIEAGDVAYHYVDGSGQISRLYVEKKVADQLSEGEMGLADCDGELVLIPATTVVKVLKRDEAAIIAYNDPDEIEDDYPTDW